MARKQGTGKPNPKPTTAPRAKSPALTAEAAIVTALAAPVAKPSALLDTRVIYCGDCLEQLQNLPDQCIDLQQADITRLHAEVQRLMQENQRLREEVERMDGERMKTRCAPVDASNSAKRTLKRKAK